VGGAQPTVAPGSVAGDGAPTSTVVTTTGSIQATMLATQTSDVVTKPEAKTALANAIAKTINLPSTAVTIMATTPVGATGDTVKVDWVVKAAVPITPTAMDGNTLKTNIESAATAVGIPVTLTTVPSVTIVSVTSAPGSVSGGTTGAPGAPT